MPLLDRKALESSPAEEWAEAIKQWWEEIEEEQGWLPEDDRVVHSGGTVRTATLAELFAPLPELTLENLQCRPTRG